MTLTQTCLVEARLVEAGPPRGGRLAQYTMVMVMEMVMGW